MGRLFVGLGEGAQILSLESLEGELSSLRIWSLHVCPCECGADSLWNGRRVFSFGCAPCRLWGGYASAGMAWWLAGRAGG